LACILRVLVSSNIEQRLSSTFLSSLSSHFSLRTRELEQQMSRRWGTLFVYLFIWTSAANGTSGLHDGKINYGSTI